jgi:hypothetical protein
MPGTIIDDDEADVPQVAQLSAELIVLVSGSVLCQLVIPGRIPTVVDCGCVKSSATARGCRSR